MASASACLYLITASATLLMLRNGFGTEVIVVLFSITPNIYIYIGQIPWLTVNERWKVVGSPDPGI